MRRNLSKCVFAAFLGAGVMATGCRTTDKGKLQSTEVAPNATADVKVKRQEKGNSEVDLKVHHLAKPETVASGNHAYVVWVEPLERRARPQNVGVLRVGSDKSGKLTTKVPFDAFTIFVTAEPTGTVSSPTGDKVLISKKVYRTAH